LPGDIWVDAEITGESRRVNPEYRNHPPYITIASRPDNSVDFPDDATNAKYIVFETVINLLQDYRNVSCNCKKKNNINSQKIYFKKHYKKGQVN
jgi:hypothetical protein